MTDDRGQAIGIAVLILSLVAGAFVVWIVREAGQPILDHASNATNNATANTATGWMETWMTYMPVAFLVIGMFGLVVLSIYLRGRGR